MMSAMHTPTLYRQWADHYAQAIHSGALPPGERMPSLRDLMARHAVSLSTAVQLCRTLEREGLLEARPRAGYFVRPRRPLASLQEPQPSAPDVAQYVGIHQRVSEVLALSQRYPAKVNLSGSCGAPSLYPGAALRLATQRALRAQPDIFSQPLAMAGCAPFLQALAQHALDAQMTLSPDELVVTHGCTEALTLALRAVAQPGEVIAVESPTYYGLLQILESLGLQALEIPASPHTGLSLEALEMAARQCPGLKAVAVTPNLHNPLGCVMPDAHKRQLLRWCQRHDIALIEDNTYTPLYDAGPPLAAIKAWDDSGQVIVCSSLHKILAPGLRLGWIAGGKWHERIAMLKYSQSRPNELLPQLAMTDYLSSGALPRHLSTLKRTLRHQREQMADAVDRLFPAGCRFSLPPGGMSIWVELPGELSSLAVFHAALQQGIRISPGVMFSNAGRVDHCLRLNAGLPYTREVYRAMHTLAQVIEHTLNQAPAGRGKATHA